MYTGCVGSLAYRELTRVHATRLMGGFVIDQILNFLNNAGYVMVYPLAQK